MARKPRIEYPGAFYHVIARGNGGQKIFRDSQDYERYLSFLREYEVCFGFLFYAYTLSGGHPLKGDPSFDLNTYLKSQQIATLESNLNKISENDD